MSKNDSTPEYGWKDSNATHAHGFLVPVLLGVFEEIVKTIGKQHLNVIDIGCGNGFLAGQLEVEKCHGIVRSNNMR